MIDILTINHYHFLYSLNIALLNEDCESILNFIYKFLKINPLLIPFGYILLYQ
jgi:hypothetical protein